QTLVDASKISGVVMIIISLAALFAWAGSTMGAFRATADLLLSVTSNEWIILLLVIVLLLLGGMVLDGVSLYLITVPLLMPIVHAFGWSAVWFGVIMAMAVAIGQVTPPVAVNLMVTSKIADVPIERTFRWVGWLVLAMVVAMVLNVLFPELSLWLPRVLGYRTTQGKYRHVQRDDWGRGARAHAARPWRGADLRHGRFSAAALLRRRAAAGPEAQPDQ